MTSGLSEPSMLFCHNQESNIHIRKLHSPPHTCTDAEATTRTNGDSGLRPSSTLNNNSSSLSCILILSLLPHLSLSIDILIAETSLHNQACRASGPVSFFSTLAILDASCSTQASQTPQRQFHAIHRLSQLHYDEVTLCPSQDARVQAPSPIWPSWCCWALNLSLSALCGCRMSHSLGSALSTVTSARVGQKTNATATIPSFSAISRLTGPLRTRFAHTSAACTLVCQLHAAAADTHARKHAETRQRRGATR